MSTSSADDRSDTPGSAVERGTEHLQTAGRELIAAARAFLDVAEEAIEDSEVVEEAGAMIRDVVARMGGSTDSGDRDDGSRSSDRDGSGPVGGREGDNAGERASRVRRIDVE
ncbi:MAG: hypothetical protein R2714_04185 [Microthrixaceae bacterium]